MQKKYTYFILFFTFFCNQVFAQITIDKSDIAKIGDNFIMAVVNIPLQSKLHIDSLGKNYWDFTKYRPQSSDTFRVMEASETRYADKFPTATIAVYRNRANVQYFMEQGNELRKVGVIEDFLNLKASVILNFRDSIIQMRFPIQYNTKYSDTTKKKLLTPYYLEPWTDSIRADIQIIENIWFDAYGKVKTPMGEFEVLRERHIVKKNIYAYKYSTLYGWTPAQEYTQPNGMDVYFRWWTKDGGLPIASAEVTQKGYVKKIRYQVIEPLQLTFRGQNVKCKGGSSGKIDLIIKGGVPNYICKWSSGQITEDLTDVPAGTYTVTVTDNKGNTARESFTLTEPLTALTTRIEKKDVDCFGNKNGVATVVISGGDKPYLQKWSIDSLDAHICNLPAGVYHVKVRDKNYCLLFDSVEITAPEKPLSIKMIPSNVKCKGKSDGALEAIVKGGTPNYQYFWSNNMGGAKIENISAGTYSLEVIDKHGCRISDKGFVTEPSEKIMVKAQSEDVTCYNRRDGAISLIVTGGGNEYKYVWSTGSRSKDIKNLKAGKYVYEITDNNKCTIKDSVTIFQPTDSLVITHKTKDVSCFGAKDGEIEISVRGGAPDYKYAWSNGTTKDNLSKLPDGIYRVTVTDKNNCAAKDTIRINAPDLPVTLKGFPQNLKCKNANDGEIKLEVIGGTLPYKFVWSNDETTQDISKLEAGKYTVIVTDKNDCEAEKDFVLKEPEKSLKIDAKISPTSCYGEGDGYIELTVTGGVPYYEYKWSNGYESQNLKGFKAGTYTVTVTDKGGCTQTQSYEIPQPQPLNADATITKADEFTDNGAIQLIITGGNPPYKINWYNGETTEKISNLKPAEYGVNIVDSKNCEITKRFKVTR